MIDHADFDELTTSPVRAPGGPPVIFAGPAAQQANAEFAERIDTWWREQGVNPEAVHAWCMGQAEEDLGMYMHLALYQDPIVLMGACLTTAYALGVGMGWRLHQRAEHRGMRRAAP